MAGSVTTGQGNRAACVEGRELGMRFGDRWALRDVSLKVEPGELIAVIGPNGAGKTTLLNLLAGIQKPSLGQVERGVDRIGWVPQSLGIYHKLTVAENLRFFARIEGVADIEGAVETMLAATGLNERADDPLNELSGGNQQRVNVAVGLLAEPQLLLMDEPTGAFDVHQRQRFWDQMRVWIDAGTAIVYTTHSVSESERHADRLLALVGGRSVYAGAPRDFDWEI